MRLRRVFVCIGAIAIAILALLVIYGAPALRQWSVERSWAKDGATVTCDGRGELKTLVAHFAPVEFDRSSLKRIPGSQSLEVLVLMYTPVTDDDLSNVRDVPRLRTLAINGTDVTDRGIARIAAIRSLEVVSLENTVVTDACISDLVQLQNLRELNVRGTKLSDNGVEQLKRQLPNAKIYWGTPLVPAGVSLPVSNNRP
jgi:Leucine Rich repeat